ncbi:hypothetical protein [Bacteroides pyogenes]
MGCYLFAVSKLYNDLFAVISDNLTVTDALAILEYYAICADDV